MLNTLDVGTVRALLPYRSNIYEQIGSDFELVLKNHGLVSDIDKEEGWIPYNLYQAVITEFKCRGATLADPLSLSFSESKKIFSEDLLDIGGGYGDEIECMLALLRKAVKEVAPSVLIWFEIRSGRMILRFSLQSKPKPTDFRLLNVYRSIIVLLKTVFGEEWTPEFVELSLNSVDCIDTKSLGYRVNLIGGRNAIPLSVSITAEKMKTYSENIIGASTTTTMKVKSIIMMFGLERTNIELICGMFGVSRRTLHRMLKDEGVTFKQLVLDIRMQLAKEMILKGISKSSIVDDLGYANVCNFLRAYRNYYKLPPNSFI